MSRADDATPGARHGGHHDADGDALAERRAALDRLRRFGGERLLRDMTAIFVEALGERVAAARAAVARSDPDGLEKAAHALRSSCGQFGAGAAARLSAEIESQAAGGAPPSSLAGAVERLARECDAYRAWLERELAGSAAAVPS
jgi:HPt (histidine-containing phosphotransfer) domain-containing protein